MDTIRALNHNTFNRNTGAAHYRKDIGRKKSKSRKAGRTMNDGVRDKYE
jgi:hypothetical protein